VRVLQLAPTVFGEQGIFGGGERYPLELARALAKHTQCQLLTFGREPADYEEANGLRVRVLRPLAYLSRHPAHPISLRLFQGLLRSDVVHAHHVYSAPSRLACSVRAVARRPTFVTDHGLARPGWSSLLPGRYRKLLAVSNYSTKTLGADAARTEVIYAGVDPLRFAPAEDGRKGVLFVGRLTPHKGVDRLLEGLPKGMPLTIAGSSGHDQDLPERDYPSLLRRMADGKEVRFIGPVAEADLPALYRSASVLVLPSVERTCYGKPVAVSELLGLVLLEAMASGTPVVASRTGGIPEIVDDGATGFLVEPGSVEQLRQRIAELASDPAKSGAMGRRGRETVLARFTWEATAMRCLQAYP
jgi:glycosyltransferase involved in cell wall biosynthesis